MVHSTTTIMKAHDLNVFKFTQIQFKKTNPVLNKIFKTFSTNKIREQLVSLNSFPYIPTREEAGGAVYMTESQKDITYVTHQSRLAGFVITQDEEQTNQFPEVSKRRAQRLVFSFVQTKEQGAANVFNNGFSTSYLYGDGKPLVSLTHPTINGVYSNTLPIQSDLSEAALETFVINMMNSVNNAGVKDPRMPKALLVPPALAPKAGRILKSELRSGTANNDMNWLRSQGSIPEIIVNPFLTSSDAYFVLAVPPTEGDGFIHFVLRDLNQKEDYDINTRNKIYNYETSYSFTVGDPNRAVFGSAGTGV